MLIGNMGGSLGEVSALALLLGMFYMLWKKIITWHVPVSIFVTVFVFTGIMHLVNPVQYASPFVHLLSGGLMLGAIFMATDYVTSPMAMIQIGRFDGRLNASKTPVRMAEPS